MEHGGVFEVEHAIVVIEYGMIAAQFGTAFCFVPKRTREHWGLGAHVHDFYVLRNSRLHRSNFYDTRNAGAFYALVSYFGVRVFYCIESSAHDFVRAEQMMDWATAAPEVFIAFGAGCVSTYTFTMKTFLKVANDRLAERDKRIAKLENKLDEMQRVFWPANDRRSKNRES